MEAAATIVTALAAGGAAGVSATATSAVTDSYAALKRLLLNRFRGDKSAEAVLSEFERDPEANRSDLQAVLNSHAIPADSEIVAMATLLLRLVSGAAKSPDVTGVQIGNHSRQINAGTYIERNEIQAGDGM
jgi:hypothetical protein